MTTLEHIHHDCPALLHEEGYHLCFQLGGICSYKNPNNCEMYRILQIREIQNHSQKGTVDTLHKDVGSLTSDSRKGLEVGR